MARKATRKPAKRKTTKRKTATAKTASGCGWSGEVTRHSHALALEPSVFKKNPKAIARSLKRSAEQSHQRKSSPYRSAMSMLTFYINRGGKNLSAAEKKKLNAAKDELRHAFHRA